MKTQRGMTLLEIMIASTILGIILVTLMAYMGTLAEAAGIVNQVTDLEQEGNEIIEMLAETMRVARIESCAAAGDEVAYTVPVDADGDEDVFDGSMNIEWGGENKDETQVAGGQMAFRFKATSTFSESARSIDLNLKNGMSETFDVGHIEIEYASGQTRALTADHVVLVMNDHDANIDGDNYADVDPLDASSADDPIFRPVPNSNRLTVTLFLTKPDEKEPILVKVKTAIQLLNPQP